MQPRRLGAQEPIHENRPQGRYRGRYRAVPYHQPAVAIPGQLGPRHPAQSGRIEQCPGQTDRELAKRQTASD